MYITSQEAVTSVPVAGRPIATTSREHNIEAPSISLYELVGVGNASQLASTPRRRFPGLKGDGPNNSDRVCICICKGQSYLVLYCKALAPLNAPRLAVSNLDQFRLCPVDLGPPLHHVRIPVLIVRHTVLQHIPVTLRLLDLWNVSCAFDANSRTSKLVCLLDGPASTVLLSLYVLSFYPVSPIVRDSLADCLQSRFRHSSKFGLGSVLL